MDERRGRLLDDIAWQKQQLSSIERDWRRLPFVSLLVLLAIPAGYLWGGVGVFLELVGSVIVSIIAAYVIHGHRTDYQDKLRSLERELNKVESAR